MYVDESKVQNNSQLPAAPGTFSTLISDFSPEELEFYIKILCLLIVQLKLKSLSCHGEHFMLGN